MRLWRDGFEFITVGHDALVSYRKRNPSNHESAEEIPPFAIYYNFLHGIELGLKAYLLHVKARELKELRSKEFGHNLAILLAEVLAHGLSPDVLILEDSNITAIVFSSWYYENKRLEYSKIGGGQIMEVNIVAKAADTLIVGLGVFFHQPKGKSHPQLERFSQEFPWFKNALEVRSENEHKEDAGDL